MALESHQPSRDHVWPKSYGGTLADPANRLIVCADCNIDKAGLSLASFADRLALAGDPRAGRVADLARAAPPPPQAISDIVQRLALIETLATSAKIPQAVAISRNCAAIRRRLGQAMKGVPDGRQCS
jgi:hypothetical protein